MVKFNEISKDEVVIIDDTSVNTAPPTLTSSWHQYVNYYKDANGISKSGRESRRLRREQKRKSNKRK